MTRPVRLAHTSTYQSEQAVSPFAASLVAFVIFVNITRLSSLYGIFDTAQLSLLLTVTGAVVMFKQAAKWQPLVLANHWIARLIFVMVIFAAAGIPTALHRGASFDILTRNFSQALLGGAMVYGVARSPAGRRLMARTLACAGVFTGVLALVYGNRDRAGRLAGAATYDPNDLALIIVLTFPLLIWWFFDNKSKLRWLAILPLPMMFSIMLRTNSRGGFLGMVAILLGLLFVGTTGRVREVRRIAITGLVLGAIGFVALPAAYGARMSSMGNELHNTSPSARINVWKRGIGYALDNPLLGVGMGNFGRAEGYLSDYSQSKGGIGVKWKAAHSSYIQAWAELGLIGGTAFLLAILGAMISLMLWRPPPTMTDPAQRMLTPMVGISLAAFAVSGAFLSFAYSPPPYYLLGFAVACLVTGGRPGQPPSGRARRGPATISHAPTPRRPLSRYPAPPERGPSFRAPRGRPGASY